MQSVACLTQEAEVPGLIPDSMTTLGQRWLKVVSSVGPTLYANVGPTSLCSSGERSANMLGRCWPNVASFFPTTFCQRYANIYGLLEPTQKSLWVKFGHRKPSYNLKYKNKFLSVSEASYKSNEFVVQKDDSVI